MKTEVIKVKAENPKLDHKEAFKVAAANVHSFYLIIMLVEKISPKQSQPEVIGALSRLSVLIGCLPLHTNTLLRNKKALLYYQVHCK